MHTPSVTFSCPHCATQVTVYQVQGDRCTHCNFEFKWFQAGEARTAQDYLAVLTGETHLVTLPDDLGYIVAHE